MYINDFSPKINTLSEPIIFTDDTSIIISSKNFADISTISNTVFSLMSKLFTADKLAPSLDTTDITKHNK
jgi:hypothetical protein